VERIGHGVRAVEDESLVKRLADEKIVLEVCPGSNIALDIFTKDNHPLRQLKGAGIQVTVSADDPPFFATTTQAEYRMAHDHFGFDAAELKALSKAALDAAFVDEATRAALHAKIDQTKTP
ncbi:MAG: adenosine deaminase, partial [Pseudomonadota bacterium]